MRPLTLHEIIPLKKPVQHFSDCYLVSSIGALARSEGGRKILSSNIAHCKDGFRVRFQDVNGKRKDYFATAQEINDLVSLDKYYNETVEKYKQNPIIKAIELGMDKLLKEHPDKKPFVSRLKTCQEKFEYNKPSNFMEMFTGRKPIVLNEDGLKMTLKKDKDKAVELFDKMDKSNDYSFVVGTGIPARGGLTSVHCYTVSGVNSDKQYIELFDCRKQYCEWLSYDKAIRALKFVTGYFNI